jgi:DNA polymerase-3 subunit delta
MQLQIHQFESHLAQAVKNGFAPVYLISGDERLLLDEARENLQKKAKEAGFLQRNSINFSTGFDWDQFGQTLKNFSLFGDKTLIELHFSSAKLDDKSVKFLLQYLEAPAPDKLLVLFLPKQTSSQQKSKWYQAISNKGVSIAIAPIYANELPQWIKKRLQQLGMTADAESIQLLIHSTEGNLLASKQALEKLRLLYSQQPITVREMATVVSNQSRYTIFDLAHAALQGNAAKVLHILKNLRAEGAEPTLILWAYLQELQRLSQIAVQMQKGKSLQQATEYEWASRKTLVQQAFLRHSLASLHRLLRLAHQIDKMIKGAHPGNLWNAFEELGLGLAGAFQRELLEQHFFNDGAIRAL